MAKEFKGVWVPIAIYQNKELNPTEKLILSDIATLSEYFKSSDTIASEVGVSRATITRAIKNLKKKQFIEISYNGLNRVIRTNIDRLNMSHAKAQNDPSKAQNEPGLGSKRATSIHTSIQPSIHISKGVIYPFDNNEFKEAWSVWLKERKEKRLRKYTQLGEQTALHNLQKISNNEYKTAIQIIKNSITHGWQGLFPIKKQKGASFETTQNTIDWINKKR